MASDELKTYIKRDLERLESRLDLVEANADIMRDNTTTEPQYLRAVHMQLEKRLKELEASKGYQH